MEKKELDGRKRGVDGGVSGSLRQRAQGGCTRQSNDCRNCEREGGLGKQATTTFFPSVEHVLNAPCWRSVMPSRREAECEI